MRVNSADFTVLDSAGGSRCLVTVCTVWPLHSMSHRVEQ